MGSYGDYTEPYGCLFVCLRLGRKVHVLSPIACRTNQDYGTIWIHMGSIWTRMGSIKALLAVSVLRQCFIFLQTNSPCRIRAPAVFVSATTTLLAASVLPRGLFVSAKKHILAAFVLPQGLCFRQKHPPGPLEADGRPGMRGGGAEPPNLRILLICF